MRTALACLAALSLLACASPDREGGGDGGPAEAPEVKVVLEPDPAHCFSTVFQEEVMVVVMTAEWALRAFLPRTKGAVETGRPLEPIRAKYLRGGAVTRLVRPPAGPPPPPLPETERPEEFDVEDLTVTVMEYHDAEEPEGYLVASFSVFRAADSTFASVGPVRLPFKGPYP